MKIAHATMTAVFALLATACDSGGAEYVEVVQKLTDQTCACKDAKCTAAATQELAQWTSANTETVSKVSAEQAQEIGTLTTKMTECATEVAMAAVQ